MTASFIDYLSKDFHKDVGEWFDARIDRTNRFYPRTVVVTSDGHGIRGAAHDASVQFKVASMYASVLSHAAAGITKDIESFYAMSKALGFPLIDLLMAGYVNPMTALEASRLLPTDQEKTVFFELAHMVYDQVKDHVLSICSNDNPKSATEVHVSRIIASDIQSVFSRTELYLAEMESYLTGESGDRPGDLFPQELLMR